MDRPTIVFLCGPTRFGMAFRDANFHEAMDGKIVLSVGSYVHDVELCPELTAQQKQMLDELHKRKIDLADEILVLNVGGYVGDSTYSEIQYAIAHGKRVRYLEQPHD